VQVRRRLTEFESTIAMLAGAGLIVLMLAFMLASARGGSQPSARVLNLPIIDLMVIGGVLLLIGALVAWFVASRPWTTAHDDWSTPLYTGHDAQHVETPAHADVVGGVTEPFAHVEGLVPAGAPGAEAAVEAMATPVVEAISTPKERAVRAALMAAEQGDVLVEGALATDAPLGLMPQVVAPDTLPADVRVSDDLTILEGIGPKIAAALGAAGISTYAKLAEQDPAELERVVRTAGVRMVGKALTWPEQAHLLAQGRLEEWKALAARLKSGR
jgi:predicted flap endonuclease-1-like 5' DNA nuclease